MEVNRVDSNIKLQYLLCVPMPLRISTGFCLRASKKTISGKIKRNELRDREMKKSLSENSAGRRT